MIDDLIRLWFLNGNLNFSSTLSLLGCQFILLITVLIWDEVCNQFSIKFLYKSSMKYFVLLCPSKANYLFQLEISIYFFTSCLVQCLLPDQYGVVNWILLFLQFLFSQNCYMYYFHELLLWWTSWFIFLICLWRGVRLNILMSYQEGREGQREGWGRWGEEGVT